jgi:hypothetical protein
MHYDRLGFGRRRHAYTQKKKMENFRHTKKIIYNIFPHTTSILTLHLDYTFVNVYMAYLRIHFYHFTVN